MKWIAVLIALVILAGILKASGVLSKHQTYAAVTSGQAPGDTGPVLSLVSSTCTIQYGVRNCEGFVRNISPKPIGGDITQQIVAEVIWMDANGTPKSTDGGYVTVNPLTPGEDSAWKTTGYNDPSLTTYRVRFKTVLGPILSTRDDRKP